MASGETTTRSGFVRNFGTKHTTAHRTQPTTSTQMKSASGSDTGMANYFAPALTREREVLCA